MKELNHFFLYWVFLLIPVFAYGDTPSVFDEMNYQELLEVNLEMDLSAVFSNRKNPEKHKAIFSFKNKKGKTRTWNIKVALRGKFRRSKCENLPPIKLFFSKKELQKAGLAEFDDLKLVTHCVNDFELAKRLLVKEYLAYKLYNQLTEESFRVQFLKINYKDTVSGTVVSQFGIVIEDLGELRNRVGAKNKKETKASGSTPFDEDRKRLVLYFNYMIGNDDWSITALRNVKVLLKEEKYFLVPYDFDFAQMVDAPYVNTNEEVPEDMARQRVFLGSREDAENLFPILLVFAVKKYDFIKTIKRCRLISRKERKELVQYILDFYKSIDKINMPNSVLQQ